MGRDEILRAYAAADGDCALWAGAEKREAHAIVAIAAALVELAAAGPLWAGLLVAAVVVVAAAVDWRCRE